MASLAGSQESPTICWKVPKHQPVGLFFWASQFFQRGMCQTSAKQITSLAAIIQGKWEEWKGSGRRWLFNIASYHHSRFVICKSGSLVKLLRRVRFVSLVTGGKEQYLDVHLWKLGSLTIPHVDLQPNTCFWPDVLTSTFWSILYVLYLSLSGAVRNLLSCQCIPLQTQRFQLFLCL